MPSPPLDLAVVLPQLHDRLRDADYTLESLRRRLTISSPDDVGALNHIPAAERLHGDRTAIATLIRLFFLELAQPVRDVAAILTRRGCEALGRSRLLQQRGGQVVARLRIDPVGEQYVLSDRRFRRTDRAALRLAGSDPVYPPGSDSLLLRDVVAAPTAGRVLDLCTGSGVQALALATRATQTVAVDINPRAVALARCNALFNGISDLDVRCGDLYAPVRGESFDLIIANPPFVASPYAAGPSYHAGGATGDRVLRRIITGLDRHLRAGGRAFAVSHVALRAGETLADVAARWFRAFPGRALVLSIEVGSPVDLAAAQSLFALDRGLTAYAREVHRWLAYLRGHRIREVAAVLVVAERTGAHAVEVLDAQPRVLPLPLTPPPARRIAEWLAAPPVDSATHRPPA